MLDDENTLSGHGFTYTCRSTLKTTTYYVRSNQKVRLDDSLNIKSITTFGDVQVEMDLSPNTLMFIDIHSLQCSTVILNSSSEVFASVSAHDRSSVILNGNIKEVTITNVDPFATLDLRNVTSSSCAVRMLNLMLCWGSVYSGEIIYPNHNSKVSECEPCEDDDENACQLCYERKINVKFSPCGHAYVCCDCCERLKFTSPQHTCPLCRSKILSVNKILL